MKKANKNEAQSDGQTNGESKDNLWGYPLYNTGEDAYTEWEEEKEIDPEDITQQKASSYDDSELGGDLDVPGSELDDQQESIGSEDEENNYYSLGDERDNQDEN